jgi:hypothetical protein
LKNADLKFELTEQVMVKTPPQQKSLLPPLENGDRLNCYEFERRYNAMPHVKKAELIEGVVYKWLNKINYTK